MSVAVSFLSVGRDLACQWHGGCGERAVCVVSATPPLDSGLLRCHLPVCHEHKEAAHSLLVDALWAAEEELVRFP